jgi:hypothetical protein
MRALFLVIGIAEQNHVGAEAPTYWENLQVGGFGPDVAPSQTSASDAASIPHKQSHERVGANLAAPVAVDSGIERGAFGQGVGRIKKFAWAKNA